MIDNERKRVSSIAIRVAGIGEDTDKVRALAGFLGVSVDAIEHVYGMVYKCDEDGAEYMVCKGDDEADAQAIESVQNTIEDCGYKCVNGWERFIDTDFFDDDRREYWRGYCEDISNEGDAQYGTRLVQEAYDNGVLTDEDFGTDEAGNTDYENCLKPEDDVVDELSEKLYDMEDPIDFVNETYGVSDNLPKGAINIGDMAEYVVNSDGRGPQLSSYDGVENEYELDGESYYIYRTN